MKKKEKSLPEILAEWRKRVPLLAGLVFLFASAGYLVRPMWFDEVITMDWLSMPLALIPFKYNIPNNHLAYTCFLKMWQMLADSCGICGLKILRTLSLLFGFAAVWIIAKRMLKAGGLFPALVCSILLAGSGAFRLYGTAIRGYMPGILFSFAAFLEAEKFLKQGKKRYFLFFMIFSCLAVGTIPTNVIAIGIGVMFLFPFVFRKKLPSVLLLLAGAFCSVWISYFHVLEKFLRNAKIVEGWYSIPESWHNLYFSFAFFFLPVLPFALIGFRKLYSRKQLRFRLLCCAGTFLVPVFFAFIFKAPPFPRVFFALFGVWTLILAYGLSAFVHGKGWNRKIYPLLLSVCWLMFTQTNSERAACMLFGDLKKDDLLCTYPMSESFVPHKIGKFLTDSYNAGTMKGCVFLDFDADPPSIQIIALNLGLADGLMLTDLPVLGHEDKVAGLSPDDWIVARNAEDLQRIRERFHLTGSYEEIPLAFSSMQKIYRPELNCKP